MKKLILPFDIDEITLDQAGGKGLNLSKIAREGFTVPRGFIFSIGSSGRKLENMQASYEKKETKSLVRLEA